MDQTIPSRRIKQPVGNSPSICSWYKASCWSGCGNLPMKIICFGRRSSQQSMSWRKSGWQKWLTLHTTSLYGEQSGTYGLCCIPDPESKWEMVKNLLLGGQMEWSNTCETTASRNIHVMSTTGNSGQNVDWLRQEFVPKETPIWLGNIEGNRTPKLCR